jgi:hypothetical protein
MSEARTAVGFDRLPWLADEPEPRARHGARSIALWVVAAILFVGAAAYWLGQQSLHEPVTPIHPSTTVALPEVRPAPHAEVTPDRVPEIQPVAVPTLRATPEREVPLRRPEPRAVAQPSEPAAAPAEPKAEETAPIAKVAAPPVASAPRPLTLWPSRVSTGAAGRLIRVGAFGSRYQAKRGWWAMVRAYPALKRYPAVVTDARNSKGRRFYRLQIGTTSQAHSEVLCQRMEKIRYSCAVVGLPWKPKGVER